MRNPLFLVFIFAIAVSSFGQTTEIFDIITYKTPIGWQKEVGPNAVQLGKQNSLGGICSITIFKSIPASGDAKANFDAAWESIVQETVKAGKPQMNPPGVENGWLVESGAAQYESDGKNGGVILITATGNSKMVNFLILMNTDAFQTDIEVFNQSVQFPRITGNAQTKQPKDQLTHNSRYKFTTTNFDNGWTSTEKDYWVETVKENTKVYLYYYFDVGDDMRPPNGNIRDNLWRRVIGKRYKILSENENRKDLMINEWKEGEAIDNETGERVYLAMSWNGTLNLAVSPNQQESYRFFPNFGTLVNMNSYNKFAIGSADELTGTWQSGGSNTVEWYNSATGQYSGATFGAVGAVFRFSGNGTYSSVQNGASGNVIGSMTSFQQEFNGKFDVSNWNLTATNRYRGKTENFAASFQAVRGGRLLILDNNAGESYTLVKTK